MAKQSYKKNIVYNSIYRCVVIITPLITSPYLSRVLGAEKLGIYSVANAFATYFVLFSLLGVNDYGNRTIAQVRDNRDKLSDNFWQIYYIQFFLTLLLLSAYLISIFVSKKYFKIQLILALYVLSSLFEINWFAFGLEEFKLTSIRNIITRLGIVVCIFLFVKNESDLWKYTLIITGGNLASLLVILPLIRKYTDFRKPDFKKIVSHIKPNVLLFLPFVATSIYQQLGKIMLGLWSTEAESGFFQNAENIVTLPTFFTTAIMTVMMPYASNLVANGERGDNKKLLYSILKYTSILNIAMACGLYAIADDFIPWYLGKDFIRSAVLVKIMAPVVFVSSCSTIIRYQYIVPQEYDTANLFSMFGGAVASVIFNVFLIPLYGAVGISISTVAAYVVTLIIQILYTAKEVSYLRVLKSIAPAFLFGILMVFCLSLISKINGIRIIIVLLEIIIGILVYMLCTVFWLEKTGDHIFSSMFHGIWAKLKKSHK